MKPQCPSPVWQRALLVAVALASLHPVFSWLMRRTLDGSDEPWGLAALAAAGWVVWRRRRPAPRELSLAPAGLLFVAYAASLWLFTPLPRALLAMTALVLLVCPLFLGRRLDLGLLGLAWLGLPLMASLDFYCSYPLRVVVAELAARLLGFSGYAPVVDGVALRVGQQLVTVDAPCSGLRMLWAGGLVVSFMVTWLGLGAWRAMLGFVGTFALLVLANALRAAALFHVELGIVELPPAGHAGVGLVVFAASAAVIVRAATWLGKRAPCAV